MTKKSAAQQTTSERTTSSPAAVPSRAASGARRLEPLVGNFAIQRFVQASLRVERADDPHEQRETEPTGSPLPHLGAGVPLDADIRASIQRSLGRDFSDVRIHVGSNAAARARSIESRAFTAGSDIVFDTDEYQPHTTAGQRLLAHELAHVVQQGAGLAPAITSKSSHDAVIGAPNDPFELEADRAAEEYVQGRRADAVLGEPSKRGLVRSSTTQRPIQRKPPDDPKDPPGKDAPGKDPVSTLKLPGGKPLFIIGFRPRIADQYPPLVTLLPEPDISGLEAASELRYGKSEKSKPSEASPETTAAEAAAKTSVDVALSQLLTPEAQFVDYDIWPLFYGTVKAGGGDELTGELARNEIMRRYFERVKLTAQDMVRIELVDPDGKKPGPSRLRFIVKGHSVPETQGVIAPPDLAVAFGTMEPDITAVSNDAQTVALAAHLVLELEDVEPIVTTLAADVPANPKDHALNEVRGVSQRLKFDQKYVDELGKRKGPLPPEANGIAARYGGLQKQIAAAVTSAENWHTANPAGESLGMMNDRVGTALVGAAGEEWDKGGGHYVVGGLAYAGAFIVAFVDAAEKVASIGFHDAATEVSKAYTRGDISWNEGEQILRSAAWRALLIAAVTRGLGALTSRLGMAAAASLGIAARTTAFGLVSGGVSGAFTGAGAVATQALTTKAMGGFTNPAAQSIWNQGMPTGTDWLAGIGGGALLGSLGGARAIRTANAKLIGTVVSTPTGPMRIIAITKYGYEVLEPLGGRVKAPAGAAASGKTITVPAGWKASSMAPPELLPPGEPPPTGGGQVLPATGGAIVLAGPSEAPLALAPPSAPVPTSGQAFVSAYLQALKSGVAASPSMLVSGYSASTTAPALPGAYGDPFGLMTPGPRPFGLLPPGPQPFGLLGPKSTVPDVSELLLAPQGRYIPGTPGIVVGGSSQMLGKNTMVSFGLPRSTSFSGWQPHHIIPSEAKVHPVIKKIGMNLDDPSNAIMLPEPATAWPGTLPTHEGYHSWYNRAALAELDKMDINLPAAVLEVKVYRMQVRLRASLEAGTPLYQTKGATPTTWPDVLNPTVPK